jgi:hypothetical protein
VALSMTAATIRVWRYIAGAQESMLQEFGDPLTVLGICLAFRKCLNVLCIRQHDLKMISRMFHTAFQ